MTAPTSSPATGEPRSWNRSAETYLAILLFIVIPTALVVYDARYHEFWRDEAQACLIAIHAPFPEFFSVMRVEGSPFLFHLVLKFFALFLPPVATLLAAGWLGFAIFLFGTYRLLLAICGSRLRSLVATLLFSTTYNYVYELGVVIRQYGMSLGLSLLTMALLREALRTREQPYVYQAAIVGALGASSSAHGACICGGAFAAFGVLALARRQLGVRTILALFAVLPFFAFTLYLATPTPGRTPVGNSDNHYPMAEFLRYAVQAIVGSFTPQDWWAASSFGEATTQNRIAVLRGWGPPMLAVGAVLGWLSRLPRVLSARALEWFDLLTILIAWVPIAEIVVNHYWGSARHQLFFSGPAVVVMFGWLLNSPWRAVLVFFATPYLLFEMAVAVLTLRLDIEKPFSDTKRAAALLPKNAHLLVESFVYQEAYFLWRPDIAIRGTDQLGRRTKFVIAGPDWLTHVATAPLLAEECRDAPDLVYFSGAGGACMVRVMEQTPPSEQFRADERFDLWHVDCACLAKALH